MVLNTYISIRINYDFVDFVFILVQFSPLFKNNFTLFIKKKKCFYTLVKRLISLWTRVVQYSNYELNTSSSKLCRLS